MANHVFFVSWELWEQMTFVLAMGIVAVFCAGLLKLWWTNRLMKKQEVLDEEKRARLEEMRKTGLPMKRANEVPFGIRAIQSGIEVDGIWISRPASLNERTASAKLASSTTLAVQDSGLQKKGRDYSEDEKSALITAMSVDRVGARQNASSVSIFQKLTDSDSMESAQSVAPPVSKFACNARRQSSRTNVVLNEDTLRRLEGQEQSRTVYETYVPTSSRRPLPQPSRRSSASSSGESVESQSRSLRSASGKSYTSSHSSKLYVSRGRYGGRAGQDSALRRWPEKEGSDPLETAARTTSGFSAFSESDTQHGSVTQGQGLSGPEPTFGPGDLHFNRSSRRVNDGFEILPAGTFGTSEEAERGGGPEQDGRVSRSANKLPKSGGHLERDGQR